MSDVGLIIGALALKKVLGPAADELGKDLKDLYKVGWERLLAYAYRKIKNHDDGKQANLRVAQDVLLNGALTNDEVCAEYFGGVLASSRSEDGKDDANIQFSSVIRSLPSSQLRLHYLIYNVLNKILVARQETFDVGQGYELKKRAIWLSTTELMATHNIKVDIDFNGLLQQGLLNAYEVKTTSNSDGVLLSHGKGNPTTFGVMLYAVAHNRLPEWHTFSEIDFGNFESIPTPRYFGATLDELKKTLKRAGT